MPERTATEVVARMLDGSLCRYSYSALVNRARQAANALDRLGIEYADVAGMHPPGNPAASSLA
ncbi:MAG: hypothetical protein O7F73_15525 [Gammaproteobacteria bacterium]|nr:hypothetical protein [Gammaproteobacteria bacterium]